MAAARVLPSTQLPRPLGAWLTDEPALAAMNGTARHAIVVAPVDACRKATPSSSSQHRQRVRKRRSPLGGHRQGDTMRRLLMLTFTLCLLLLLPVAAQALTAQASLRSTDSGQADLRPSDRPALRARLSAEGRRPHRLLWARTRSWACATRAPGPTTSAQAILAAELRAAGLQERASRPGADRRVRLQVGRRDGRQAQDDRLHLRRRPADRPQGP